MPTYQYACNACGENLEAVQAFSDPSLTECPACRGQLRKVFSAVGVVFKGSGFYKTDSRASSSSTSPASAGETSTEKKAETKAEKKSESPAKTESAPSTSSSPSSTTTSPAA